MIKHFCDFCGDEIVKGHDGKHVVPYEDKELLISVTIPTGEEICTACIAAVLDPGPEDYEIVIEDPVETVAVPAISITADSNIDALKLSNRTRNALARYGYNTIRELMHHTESELLMRVGGLGEGGMLELSEKLAAHGLSL